jgi:hypothetical protein
MLSIDTLSVKRGERGGMTSLLMRQMAVGDSMIVIQMGGESDEGGVSFLERPLFDGEVTSSFIGPRHTMISGIYLSKRTLPSIQWAMSHTNHDIFFCQEPR